MTWRMFSSTRKCCPRAFLGTMRAISGRREPERGGGVAIDLRLELVRVDAPDPGERGEGVHRVGGLVGAAAVRLRGEEGAVGLDEDAVGGSGRGGVAEGRRARVR